MFASTTYSSQHHSLVDGLRTSAYLGLLITRLTTSLITRIDTDLNMKVQPWLLNTDTSKSRKRGDKSTMEAGKSAAATSGTNYEESKYLEKKLTY